MRQQTKIPHSSISFVHSPSKSYRIPACEETDNCRSDLMVPEVGVSRKSSHHRPLYPCNLINRTSSTVFQSSIQGHPCVSSPSYHHFHPSIIECCCQLALFTVHPRYMSCVQADLFSDRHTRARERNIEKWRHTSFPFISGISLFQRRLIYLFYLFISFTLFPLFALLLLKAVSKLAMFVYAAWVR